MAKNKSTNYMDVVASAESEETSQVNETNVENAETPETTNTASPSVEEPKTEEKVIEPVEEPVKEEKPVETAKPVVEEEKKSSMAHGDVLKVVFIKGLSRNTRTATAKRTLEVLLSNPFGVNVRILNNKAEAFIEYVNDNNKNKINPQIKGFIIRQLKITNNIK